MTDQDDNASRRANLSTAKQELLRQRLAGHKKTVASAGVIPKRADGPAPLSYAQERLWFLDKLVPGSAAYNIVVGIRMRGRLDSDALEQSVRWVAERHQVLRASFPSREGRPVQELLPVDAIRLERVELPPGSVATREVEARDRLRAEAQRSFDLERGPLFRALLLGMGDEDQILLLVMHHAVSDGWSMTIAAREITMAYHSFARGERPQLAPLPLQYDDYAAWHRQRMEGPELEGHIAFWRTHLDGAPTTLELPTDRPRPLVQSFRGARHDGEIPADTTRRLREFCARERVTPFAVLLSAFHLLLAKYSNQRDVVVGVPTAGRGQLELESLVGLFVNTLAVRGSIADGPNFRTLVTRLQQTMIDAQAHQDLPIERLVDALHVQRDLSRPPLYQVMFVLQNLEEARADLGDLQIEDVPIANGTSKFDLNLLLKERRDTIAATFEYASDLFEPSTVARMWSHYLALLAAGLDQPTLEVDRLPMLDPAERDRFWNEWNDTGAPYPSDLCLHELFEQQCDRTPAALAVVSGTTRLTYADLDARANRLARHLRQAGARPESFVAVVMEKGWEQIVAVLAIHKAGAAYVPVDPHLPTERLHFILESTASRVALTQSFLEPLLQWPQGTALVAVDTFSDGGSAERLDRVQTPDQLAYVIFTSGSTGQPKGVLIEHRGAVNTCHDVNRSYGIGSADRVLAISALNFDLSVWDVFGTLGTGGAIVVPPASDAPDPAEWLALVERERVTVWNSVPALIGMCVDYAESVGSAALSSLRLVMMSGDWIPVPLPDRIRSLVSGVRLISMGGATEASIWSIVYPIDAVDPAWRSIPYGKAMANQKFFVLDAGLEPCPIGVPGALYIGGIGLARGYHQDEAKTAASFIRHPRTGERLYRAGDLGRYFPDGNIEFLGRNDFQVKIHGYRIELGEIEAVLRQSGLVREGVVAVRVQNGDKRLVAYLVSSGDERPTAAVKEALLRSLPAYMVPSAFVWLDGLPQSANGKIDRKLLPALEEEHDRERAFAAPEGPVETAIAEVWCRLLQRARVARDDNFFEVGGHSLLMIRLREDLSARLGREFTIVELFENPTPASLARHIEKGSERTDDVARGRERGTVRAERMAIARNRRRG